MTTIIIGGGAAGLAAAIRLKQNRKHAEVIVLERLETAGKKLLATGNGRCNITNTAAKNYKETVEFFSSIGLVLREEDGGRVYPYSLKAETVLEALNDACSRLGVEIITECTVSKIDRDLTVYTDRGLFTADRIILAAGGRAQKSLGSDGSGYQLLKSLGHSITPLSPALVQLNSSSRYPRAIKGTRTKCSIRIELDGETAAEEYGEVLFTDYGLSGIAVMNLSETVGRNFALSEPKKCIAVLDLIPEMSKDEIKKHIDKFGSLKGILGTRLSEIIMKQADGSNDRAAQFSKSWRLIITGTKGYDFAQITSGGVPLTEVENFKSKIIKGLYICGEILDLQYACGGFNLDSAWHSGITAADMIAREYSNDKD